MLLPVLVETAPQGGNNIGMMKPPLKLRGEVVTQDSPSA